MSVQGSLISAGLTARVHWTLGRAANAVPEDAVRYGEDLVEAIQGELRDAYKRGAQAARQRVIDNEPITSPAVSILSPTPASSGYADGSIV